MKILFIRFPGPKAQACLFAFLANTVSLVHAQSDEAHALPAVVVTASRVSQLQVDTIAHTTVISAEDIRSSQARDLPALLRNEAGLQLTQNGGLGASGGLFMRGAETRQTLVLLDGVPITKTDGTGTVSFEHIMLDQIDHIEIVRGNVSSIYGSGAIGGVIQLFSKAGYGAGQQASVSTELGSNGDQKIAFGIGGSDEGLRYQLSAAHIAAGGFSAINTSQKPDANPDKDRYTNDTVSGLLAKSWSKGHEAGVQFSHSAARFDFDSPFGTAVDTHYGKTNLSSYSLFSNDKLSEGWISRLKLSEMSDRNANQYNTESPFKDNYLSKTRTAEWNNELKINPDWVATAGANHQWQSFVADDGSGGLYDLKRAADSVFGGLQGTLGRHQFQANLRHDHTESVGGADTGFLGYGFALDAHVKLLANVSTGFTAPSLGYLYGFGGNPDLKPEHSNSIESGIQYANGNSVMRMSLFRIRTKDQLTFVFGEPCSAITDPCGKFENLTRTQNQGLEFSATHKWDAWSVRASLTLQDPIDLDTNETLRRRAKVLGSLAAYKSLGPLQYGFDMSYTGQRNDDTDILSDYWLANISSRYMLDKQWSVQGRVANLFDTRYQTAYGFNQPPRAVFVGLNWTH